MGRDIIIQKTIMIITTIIDEDHKTISVKNNQGDLVAINKKDLVPFKFFGHRMKIRGPENTFIDGTSTFRLPGEIALRLDIV